MMSVGLAALVLALVSPVQPKTNAPTKIAPSTASSGGAAAEPSAETRTSPPAALQGTLQGTLRVVLSRLGDDVTVSPAEQVLLDGIVVALRADDEPTAMQRWKQLVTSHKARTGAVDVDALAQWVLYGSYLEPTDELASHADKVKALNRMNKEIREHLNDIRERLKTSSSGGAKISMPTLVLTPKPVPGKKPVAPGKKRALSVAQWEAYAAKLEQDAVWLDDQAQQSTLALQSILMERPQHIQMMSNISKTLNDTAMAIIAKTKG